MSRPWIEAARSRLGRVHGGSVLVFILAVAGCLAIAAYLMWPRLAKGEVRVDDEVFKVRIMHTDRERRQGLMGLPGLGEREGMLFVYEKPARYPYWMKDMLFAIDIIYINNGRIVDMALNMPPPKPGEAPASFRPAEPAERVLEVAAGTAQKLGWAKGTRVIYP